MRQMTMQQIWIDGDKVDWGDRVEGLAKTLWRYGWGLLFIIAMTVLSEWGPRAAYSKIPPAPAAISQPAAHTVK
jgi:hypothetical protein